MITFEIKNREQSQVIEIPEGINLSLMEVLKASDYPVLATCGGMALCATCHVEIERGEDNIPAATDIELDMIDTLPDASDRSRLACQIRVNENLQGATIVLKG
ncbi:MAG TPA: 2Fe-2S iron-sulfur cluster-binding protein [Ohtaekwangia sp.]|nr:2Fe-2S iron-sulfur cluster-binding protein [Ohtaekwangia sp.]